MDTVSRVIATLDQIVHRRMLLLVVFSYALAATWPAAGLWMKDARIVDLAAGSARLQASVPAVLLAFLLFGAGVRVRGDRVRVMARRPALVLAGLVANLAVPVAYLWPSCRCSAVAQSRRGRDDPGRPGPGGLDAGGRLLDRMGAAAERRDGAEPWPGAGLDAAEPPDHPPGAPVAGAGPPGRRSADLHSMASGGTGTFLMAWVLIPSLLGIALRGLLPERWIGLTETLVKRLATADLARALLRQRLGLPPAGVDTPTGTSWEP